MVTNVFWWQGCPLQCRPALPSVTSGSLGRPDSFCPALPCLALAICQTFCQHRPNKWAWGAKAPAVSIVVLFYSSVSKHNIRWELRLLLLFVAFLSSVPPSINTIHLAICQTFCKIYGTLGLPCYCRNVLGVPVQNINEVRASLTERHGRWVAACPAMSFVFVCWHTTNKYQKYKL